MTKSLVTPRTPFWFDTYTSSLLRFLCNGVSTKVHQKKNIGSLEVVPQNSLYKWQARRYPFTKGVSSNLKREQPYFFWSGSESIFGILVVRLQGTGWTNAPCVSPTNATQRYDATRRTVLWSTWVTSWDDGPMTVGARRFTEWWILQKTRRQRGEGAWPLPSSITSTRHWFGRKDSAKVGDIWEKKCL